MNSPRSRAPVFIFAGCLTLFVCLVCGGLFSLGAAFFIGQGIQANRQPTITPQVIVAAPSTSTPTLSPSPTPSPSVTPLPDAPTPTITVTPSPLALVVPAGIVQQPAAAGSFADLDALRQSDYPVHDYYESARRLSDMAVGQRTVSAPAYAVGDSRVFITDSGRSKATLVVVTDHLYFWVEDGLDLDVEALVAAAEQLETDYLPRLRHLFGDIWQPGMDNDAHFSVLHLEQFASHDEIGYFDSGDEYPRTINTASNEQEIIYLNMEFLEVGDEWYLGTLVHEIEHLIQWYVDGNEATWLDEGLAQLAETANGLDSVDTYLDWLAQPDIQLNRWNYEDDDAVYAHYGAAYLLSLYVWEQLGEEAVRELSRHSANGLEAVQEVLRTYRPETSLEQFLADWAAANWLDGESPLPRYGYEQLHLRDPHTNAQVKRLPYAGVEELSQFGVDYVELSLSGPVTITFAGDTLTPLAAVPPRSGSRMWLAPPLDNLSAQLTQAFDLTGLSQATLNFWAWYDLEPEWDFAYVAVSVDAGTTWSLLDLEHATAGQYGPAFGGRSAGERDDQDGWVAESISLDAYVGGEVWLRFELLTDSALTNGVFAVDDIAIPELNYGSDAETGDDGWQAAGFVRTGWQLPQIWSVQLIENDNLAQPRSIALNALNQGQLALNLGRRGGVLVIMPQTPFTGQPASYWLQIESPSPNN
ncbi:MAG: immune inhibitor A [Candidatus Promineifilaceae bacterium]